MDMTFFASLTPYAGIDNRVVSLANRFAERGNNISFLTFVNRRYDLHPKIEINEYRPFSLDPEPFFYVHGKFSYVRYLFQHFVSRQLKKTAPRIVCVDHEPMDWYASRSKKQLHFKLVYTFHGFLDFYEGTSRGHKLKKYRKHAIKLLKKADLVVTVSEFAGRQLQEAGIDSIIIPNGVDTSFFKPNKPLPNFTKAGPVILHVGTIMPHKGIHFLIDAFRLAKKEISSLTLYVVGGLAEWSDGKYLSHLLEQTADVCDSVIFLQNTKGGTYDDFLASMYSNADIFVCASQRESFGMPFLEAQASGKPCIGFNSGATPEVVINEKTGILVEKGSIDEMANAIVKLIIDDELRKKMGEDARKHAEEFDWNRIADHALRIYKGIV